MFRLQRIHGSGSRGARPDGALLALLANLTKKGTPILELCLPQGINLRTQADINKHFHHYYSQLYTGALGDTAAATQRFLTPLPLAELTLDEVEELGGDIAVQEIQGALRSMASGKVPGTDGLPVEF